jgi:hypothetical protein
MTTLFKSVVPTSRKEREKWGTLRSLGDQN